MHALACIRTGVADPATMVMKTKTGQPQHPTSYGDALLDALTDIGDEWLATHAQTLIETVTAAP